MAKKKRVAQEVPQEAPPVPTEGAAPAVTVSAVAPREPPTITDELLSPEELERILQERARALAQAPAEEGQGVTAQVVIFALGEEVYGVEASYVENIYLLQGLTPVPCTPDFVVGVVNVRGRILSVVDLHRFLGLEGIPIGPETQVMAVSAAGLEVGLLASEVRAVVPLALDVLGPALPTMARVATEYTRGVTPDMVVLLDLEALLRDRRMVVEEEA